MRAGPERTDARRYARDIYVLHLPGGGTEWHFMRGRTSADTPETFVPASDVSCDASAL